MFRMLSGVLPTRARLHHLNAARWERDTCTWCNTTEDWLHALTQCQKTSDAWNYAVALVSRIDSQIRATDRELLSLDFPDSRRELDVSYIIVKTVKELWSFSRQQRKLTPERLRALLKQDINRRRHLRVPALSADLIDSL